MTKFFKKPLILILSCAMVLSMLAPAFGATTTSDYGSHWASDTIQSAIDSGMAKGYPDGKFRPDNAITRGEFFSLVNNAFEFTAPAEDTYIDVEADAWYAPVVAKAKAAGYIAGYPDGSIHPKMKISRQEVAVILSRLKSLSPIGSTLVFTDATTVADWSKQAIIGMLESKVMIGYPDGSFKPEKQITRAEALVALNNILNYEVVGQEPEIVEVETVRVDQETMTLTVDGDTETITVTITPDNATDKDINWTSSDTDVATVKGGIVTPVGIGTATITGSSEADETVMATTVVTVNEAEDVVVVPPVTEPDIVEVETVLVDQETMTLKVDGDTETITATITPDNATDKDINWTSSDTDVATVKGGIVTPISIGTATITGSSEADETVMATTVVTVNEADAVVVVPPVTPIGNPVDLGTAGDYVILAKTGISTVPPSAITGNIGVSPAASTYITGFSLIADASNQFSTSPQITGEAFAATYAAPTASNLTTAISNMETAYTDAAGRAADYTELHNGDLSGKTLTPGVYKWGTGVLINSDVTLSGGSEDVFIFQISQGITQASNTSIILTGGVQAKNIFWQTADTVTIGTGAHFEGIILSKTNISLDTGSSINGRLLVQTAVTLNQSTVVEP